MCGAQVPGLLCAHIVWNADKSCVSKGIHKCFLKEFKRPTDAERQKQKNANRRRELLRKAIFPRTWKRMRNTEHVVIKKV